MTPDISRVLVVDDEPQIIQALRTSLNARGYEVRSADDGESAMEIFRRWKPELIITDLSMPKMGGINLCRAIRSCSHVPIIVLSVNGQESTKVEALECGADDYVMKPFGTEELVARMRAVVRRGAAPATSGELLESGDFSLDFTTRKVEIQGREIHLTPKEFDLLAFLLQNSGKVLTHKSVQNAVWGRTHMDQQDAVYVLVRQLRKKIESNPAAPKYLRTEPWIGYRFEPAN